MSRAAKAIFREYDPNLRSESLDEAYLDVTEYCQMHGLTGLAAPCARNPSNINHTLTSDEC